ncbi:MAG TPA: hypothetical protein VGX50_18110 [Longimicrobium sp.]|jgi:hypothetical protein|nr:hypothetical protein [Longimicrobium sp.]
MIRPALLLILLLVGFPGATRAQVVAEGARVRVLASSIHNDWILGTVASADSAALRLRVPPAGATLVVPMEELQRVQASRGRGRATLEGAITGGTLGALIGFFAVQPGEGGSCARGCGGASGGGFVIGAGIGTVAGALLGSRIRTGPERWREVPLPPR